MNKDKDYESIKYHAARKIYRKLSEKTPSGKLNWLDWWEKKFNDKYLDYIELQKKTKKKEPK